MTSNSESNQVSVVKEPENPTQKERAKELVEQAKLTNGKLVLGIVRAAGGSRDFQKLQTALRSNPRQRLYSTINGEIKPSDEVHVLYRKLEATFRIYNPDGRRFHELSEEDRLMMLSAFVEIGDSSAIDHLVAELVSGYLSQILSYYDFVAPLN